MPPAGGKPYSAADAIGYGWKKFTENVGMLLVGMLLFGVITGVLYWAGVFTVGGIGILATNNTDTYSTGEGVLMALIALVWVAVLFLWSYVIQAGLARAGLAATNGQPIELSHLLSTHKVGSVVVAAIVVAIPTIAGQLLLALGAAIGAESLFQLLNFLLSLVQLVVSFLAMFYIFFILDEDLGAVDSLKASFQLVQRNVGSVILFVLLALAVTLLGVLICCIGLLAAIPVVVVGQAYTYKVLRGQPVAP